MLFLRPPSGLYRADSAVPRVCEPPIERIHETFLRGQVGGGRAENSSHLRTMRFMISPGRSLHVHNEKSGENREVMRLHLGKDCPGN